jgi:hypothetical protein
MIDTSAKSYLHNDFHNIRATMLWKLDGLAEYDIRRPMTPTGTNLLGLIKHLSNTEVRYFGEVFGHPFPERPPRWTPRPTPTCGRPSTKPAPTSSTDSTKQAGLAHSCPARIRGRLLVTAEGF